MRVKIFVKLFFLTFLIKSCTDKSLENISPEGFQLFKTRVDSLNDLSFSLLRKKDYALSMKTFKYTDSLARKIDYLKGLSRSLRGQAYNSYFTGQSVNALDYLNEAEEVEQEINNYKGLAATYNTRALIFKNSGLYSDALNNYRKVLSLNDFLSEKNKKVCLNNIANTYTKISRYDSAVVYYLKTLELKSVIENPRTLSIVYTNLGNAKSLLENFPIAQDYYEKALSKAQDADDIRQQAKTHNNLGALFFETKNDKKALFHYQKSIDIKERFQDSLLLAQTYLNIADLYAQRKSTMLFAKEYLKYSELVFEEFDDKENLAKVYRTIALFSVQNKDYPLAKLFLLKAERLVSKSSDLVLKREISKSLAEVLNTLGERKKAFEKYQYYSQLKDSVLNTEKLWQVAELEKQHQIKIKQGEISLLQKDRDLAELKIIQKKTENRNLSITLFGTVFIVMLLILLIVYLQKLRKTNKKITAQKEQLLEEQLENLIQNQEIEIINATLEGREKEKAHISKELHNNVGSLLTAVKFHLNGFNKKLVLSHKATQDLYFKVVQMVDNVINEVRVVSHRLDADASAEFNLEKAIVEFSDKVQNKNLKIETSIHGLDNFPHPQTSIFIFRILQELVNNALKHAKASLLTLYLTRSEKNINIMVEDNGKGFEMKNPKKGIGLHSLKKQVLNKKGDFTIDSVKMKGTTIVINIPV